LVLGAQDPAARQGAQDGGGRARRPHRRDPHRRAGRALAPRARALRGAPDGVELQGAGGKIQIAKVDLYMDINRLTQKSQEALQAAQTKALRYGQQEVDGEHLLLALLEQPEGLAPRLLNRMDASAEAIKSAGELELERRPHVSGPGAEAGKIYLTQRL